MTFYKFQSARDLYGQSQIIKIVQWGDVLRKKWDWIGWEGGRGDVRKTNKFLSITILEQVG
jgi:hypothetical protein